MTNKIITINGKTYEVLSKDDQGGYSMLWIKELPSSPPKEYIDYKIFEGTHFKFHVNKFGRLDIWYWDGGCDKWKPYDNLETDDDLKALKQAVDCAEKIREVMK